MDTEGHDWNKHRLNFHRPNSGIPAQTHNLVMADFLPDEPNSKLKNHLEDFSKGIDELNKKNLCGTEPTAINFGIRPACSTSPTKDTTIKGPTHCGKTGKPN